MILDAPAKINLSLRVLAKEQSGFHQIETLFCALELCDEVEADRAPTGIDVTVVGTDASSIATAKELASAPKMNLVYRAAAAFFETAKLDGGASITLRKRIPSGAGLGGGSTDAAATLQLLNELYARPLTREDLIAIATGLGSDVPFFLCGSPLALAWGRGTRVMPLKPLTQKNVLLVAPNEKVGTADAYNALSQQRAQDYAAPGAVLDGVMSGGDGAKRWADVAYNAVNDFEAVIFAKIPELSRIKADLERHGAPIAMMTGSGSVMFGIFDDDDSAEAAARAIGADFRNVRTILTRTADRTISLSAPPPPLS